MTIKREAGFDYLLAPKQHSLVARTIPIDLAKSMKRDGPSRPDANSRRVGAGSKHRALDDRACPESLKHANPEDQRANGRPGASEISSAAPSCEPT